MHLHRPLPISVFKRQISMNTISEYQVSVCLILSHTNILVVRELESQRGTWVYCAMAPPKPIERRMAIWAEDASHGL